MKLNQFFQEDNGTYSSARLMAFTSVLCFISDWALHIYRNIDFTPSWSLIGLVLGVCGFKVVQKFAETKNDLGKTTDIQTS